MRASDFHRAFPPAVCSSERAPDATAEPAAGEHLGAAERQAMDRAAGAEIRALVGQAVTAEQLCDSPPSAGPDECPRDRSP